MTPGHRLAGSVLAGLALAGMLAGCGAAAPARPGASRPASPPHSPTATAVTVRYAVSGLLSAPGKYLGLEAPGAPGSLEPETSFAANVGRPPNLVGEFVAWRSPFDAQAARAIWTYGALPYLAWEPYDTTLQAIAAGRSNAYIRAFAAAVRAYDLPVAISFGHEMNGNWYPWGVTGATASQFVAAWRRIHDLFAAAGATNVIWIWNPNAIQALPQVQLRPYYPGDAYVNWIGITAYFTPGTDSFQSLFGPTISEVRAFTGKPFLIAETSIQSGPGASSAAASLISAVRYLPYVLGFVWFDYDKAGVDWRLESRPGLRAQIAAGVAGLSLVPVHQASEVQP